MSAIQILTGKNHKRTVTAFDQRTSFTQGYKDIFNQTSTQTIASIQAASGVITLSNVYPQGVNALQVWITGITYDQPGVDYTEVDNRTIQLNGTINAALLPLTDVIVIRWNRFLPGARDQSFEDLVDITPDLSASVRDPGILRASPATAANPLATLADTGAVTPLSFTSTAAVLVGHAVYISSANTVLRALADAFSTSWAIGVVISKPVTTTAHVQQINRITGLSGLTVGAPVFVSDVTPGLITSTAPTATGSFVVELGVADSTTSVILNVRDPQGPLP